jgi:serine/threonine-protein kinase
MGLTAGSRLGSYEILTPLGAGGMGEVWRARDTKLGREVALKVLPESLSTDPDRLARFEREAQLLAALNHPHIAAIYGVEDSTSTKALVLELVEGATLDERLAGGALPLEAAMAIGRQIAEALEAAHERGVIHRDLKPQNVKITPEGEVKVLDFGLAKALDPSASAAPTTSPTLMNSPTLTAAGTQIGVILGTAAYMSPEQAKGIAVDKRADIWAFGVLLYEMLCGRRLFAGDSVPETLAGVLKNPIDLEALPADTPPDVRRLLARCLERNPKDRLRDIGEARVALDPRLSTAMVESAPVPAGRSSLALRFLPWALVMLAGIAVVWMARRSPGAGGAGGVARSPVLALHLPAGLSIPLDDRGIYGQTGVLAIAPDGSRIAFIEGLTGKGPIYLREIDGDELRPLEGTAGASSPFFSPDGRWVGYFSPGKMRKVSVAGGRPVDLADASLDRGAVWCPDGWIVFAPNATAGLSRLPAGGGQATALTQLDVEHGERTHRWPAVLPGGREVAFTVGRAGQPGNYEDAAIDAVDLATGKRRALFRGASMVRFTSSGIALLGREGQVLALPVSGASGGSADEATQVLRNVAGVPASGVVHFDVAGDGTLVYAERDPRAAELELAWFGRNGEARPLALPKQEYRMVRFSPDGRRVAMAVGPGGGRGGDIWVHDLGSGALSKVTFDGKSWGPVWTRDGKSVTFAVQLPSGGEQFRQRLADGSQAAVTIADFKDGHARAPIAWMPDGSLLFWEDGGAGSAGNIVYLPPGGGEPRPFASTPAIEIQPAVSPDGRYVAYDLDETGLREIYVQPFPPTGAKWQIAEGASVPLWSADGRELFFVQGRDLVAVQVSTAGAFSAGSPHTLFEIPPAAMLTTDTSTTYDVAPDGRFLVVRSGLSEPMGGHLVVVLNWLEKLNRTLAAGRS